MTDLIPPGIHSPVLHSSQRVRRRTRLPVSLIALIVVIGAFPATAEDGRGRWLHHEKMVGNMAVERTRQERERLVQARPRGLANASREPFRDCAACPALVAIEPGRFLMGPQENSRCRDENDPVVEVTIAHPFAAGVFEVTVDEWAACRREGECTHDPREAGSERANRPVTDVSWEDAQQYVRWLSAKTGERYRLLSEAEWLYVASQRKDGTNWYPFRWSSRGPNRFGLHALGGSVMEWLDEPGSRCFTEAPNPSRQNDDLRILRGPSDCYFPRSFCRSIRAPAFRSERDECFGFRVARELGE